MPAKKKPDDTKLKAAVLDAALKHAPFDGFSDKTLTLAGKEAGVTKDALKRLFPEGPLSLVELFSDRADAYMEKSLAGMDLKSMKIRSRISAAVMARIHALREHKEAARRAAAFLTLPPHAALGAKLVYRTVDKMWRAAGDTSTDFNFYTKRGILAGVYSSTLMRWFTDTSSDEKATTDFLAARIENVMQFEKFKAEAKSMFDRLPPLSDVLGAFNVRR
ncbi:MAG: COQ9 family protein [Alphaproteobacteria bacterium]|nr:COQ9 family protein [Alphaproteobacteria bacterium]MBL6940015.1 COQ9 family protein [Alphaproteobacteria bacterium]MBL7098129.1 COQ9 family protein [Alphaproteobacteria bacterium]